MFLQFINVIFFLLNIVQCNKDLLTEKEEKMFMEVEKVCYE